MRIGMIGLGRMGANMSLRLLRGGHQVVGFDLQAEARDELVERGGEVVDTVGELVQTLATRGQGVVIWLMVPAGPPVEATLGELEGLLTDGAVVVDGGNSNYKQTIERAERMGTLGIEYVDVGTSGGVWGLDEGYSMMVGGSQRAVEAIRPLLETLAPAPDLGWGHVGPSGAGHFVKMVHNGIEYGLMQAYAEGFSILDHKRDFNIDLAEIAEIWRHGSVVRSWLLDLTARALLENPSMDGLEPWVDDSGEGRWTVTEAIDLDVPAPVISLALIERLNSRDTDSYSHRLLAAMRAQFGGHSVKKS